MKTAIELKEHPQVQELREIQDTRGLPDGDFARVVKFAYSGSSWGKIKAGTFAGNPEKALAAVQRAIAYALAGDSTYPEDDGIVLLPHVQELEAALSIARTATDEHRLAVICGPHGSGKSTSLEHCRRKFGGVVVHAMPGWSKSYFYFLREFAKGIGMAADFRAVSDAEPSIITRLADAPQLILIDEGNHFNRDSLNFLKSILNRTRSCIVLATLPPDLARMAAENASETRQLLRRAVAITHIGRISSDMVLAVRAALFPGAAIQGLAVQIANVANRKDHMDTVREILSLAAEFGDTESAIATVENSKLAVRPAGGR